MKYVNSEWMLGDDQKPKARSDRKRSRRQSVDAATGVSQGGVTAALSAIGDEPLAPGRECPPGRTNECGLQVDMVGETAITSVASEADAWTEDPPRRNILECRNDTDDAFSRAVEATKALDQATDLVLRTIPREVENEALDRVYEVCVQLRDEKVRQGWLDARGVKPHGNAKNCFQPIVAEILNKATSANARDSRLRKDASRWAGAMAIGVQRNTPIGEFSKLVSKTGDGLRGLAEMWTAQQRAGVRTAEAVQVRESELDNYLDEGGDNEDDADRFHHHTGRIICALDLEDGVKVHERVLEWDHKKATALIERYARRAKCALKTAERDKDDVGDGAKGKEEAE